MLPFWHFIWTAFNFEIELLIYTNPDSNTVKHSEKTGQLAEKLSAIHLTQGQPQQPTLSSSDSGVHTKYGTPPFQNATSGELDHLASLQIICDRTPGSNGVPSLLHVMNDKPRGVSKEDSEGSTEYHVKLVASDASSEKEVARLQLECTADFERQLSETLAERDRHIAQLTDELARKSALPEQAEANAAEEKMRAGIGRELRELQGLDKSLLSRDHPFEQAQSCSAESILRR